VTKLLQSNLFFILFFKKTLSHREALIQHPYKETFIESATA